MKVKSVLVEVDDLNGHKATVALDAIEGTQIPVTQVDRHLALALRVLSVEADAGGEAEKIAGEVIDQVSRILDQTTGDHVRAAQADLDDAMETASRTTRRSALVQAAAHLLHAIHYEDRTGPVEVRKDDLRRVLDSVTEAAWQGIDDAVSRLRDALEGPR